MPTYPDCDCNLSGTAFGAMVNEMLAIGMSFRAIEIESKAKGRTIKRETVSHHLKNCLQGLRPTPNPVAVSAAAATQPAPQNPQHTATERDLARLVQRKAMEGVANGTLPVTVRDGLAATKLLDQREARQEDRKFMVGLARLLSGAGIAGPKDGPEVIDVTPNPMLAPASLRADD